MAGSVNKVILLGNLGKDPDIRATTAGSRLASFSIATSTKYRNKDTQQCSHFEINLSTQIRLFGQKQGEMQTGKVWGQPSVE